jgi:hypothetical protein
MTQALYAHMNNKRKMKKKLMQLTVSKLRDPCVLLQPEGGDLPPYPHAFSTISCCAIRDKVVAHLKSRGTE